MNTPLSQTIQFRRVLFGDKWDAWLQLVERLMRVTLTNLPDAFNWNLTTSGIYTVKSLYADLLNGHTRYFSKYLWKLKIPLKIKIFLWFLHRKVLLTKDNLVKRRWSGCTKCVFCHENEMVQHLFISCSFARNIWRLLHFTFNISPPTNIANMFGLWLNGIDSKTKARIRIGVSALLWSIWNCRNDIVFNKSNGAHYLQVINRAIYWINSWSLLLPVDQRALMDTGCTRMLAVVRSILCPGGWFNHRRLNA